MGPEGLPTHLRVVGPLGSGGSATVWRARDTRAGVDVALKLIDAGGSGAADRLEREVRSLARLRPVPGIVAVRECGVTGRGAAWLVTDLVEGPSLAERLRVGQLDLDAALDLAASLAESLAAAHELGIAHGDLTPANVLFDADRPVLVDLGLAGLDGSAEGIGCTPAYSPPERLRGAPPSSAADVWSLATVVSASVAQGIELPEVLSACLAERPSQRPSAGEVAERLRPRPLPRSRWPWGRRS